LGGTRFTAGVAVAWGSETAVWQVEILPGTPPTPHSMTREEVFVVLEGTASVLMGGAAETAHAGDAILVPADVSFDLANAGDGPLRLLACLPVGGLACLPDGEVFAPPWTL
jgi:mannose-6-phosphate isomerase-like protein (cupin superfamily)